MVQFWIFSWPFSRRIPLIPYSIMQFVRMDCWNGWLWFNTIALQLPGSGSSWFAVNLMGLSGVPLAISVPWAFMEKLPPNLISTPGSIVRVALG